MLAFFALALLVSAQSTPAHGISTSTGHVLVVGGPRGFATIQAAVDHAEDGDVLLVKSGTYPGFAIGSKGISVVADTGAIVAVEGAVTVDGVPPGLSAVIAGLEIRAPLGNLGLSAVGVAGSLRVEECSIAPATSNFSNQPAVLLDANSDVALVMCTIQGSKAWNPVPLDGVPGWPAVRSISSSVAIQDCVLVGGEGDEGMDTGGNRAGRGGEGGPGLLVEGGFAYLSGCDVRGGPGGQGGDNYGCTIGGDWGGPGGNGGPAVRVTTAPSSPAVVMFGVVATPGAGGPGGIDYSDCCYNGPCFGDGPDGAAGVPIDAPSGAVDFLAGSSRRLIAPHVARENRVIAAHAYGQPGDFVQVFASARPQFAYLPQFRGVQLMQLQQSVLLATGTVPAGGALDLQLQMPNLQVESASLFLQAYFRDPADQRYVATQITLIELGSQF